jgi:hypothetical protein
MIFGHHIDFVEGGFRYSEQRIGTLAAHSFKEIAFPSTAKLSLASIRRAKVLPKDLFLQKAITQTEGYLVIVQKAGPLPLPLP